MRKYEDNRRLGRLISSDLPIFEEYMNRKNVVCIEIQGQETVYDALVGLGYA